MKNNNKYVWMAAIFGACLSSPLAAVTTTVSCKCINATMQHTEGTVEIPVCQNKACTSAQKDEDIQKAFPAACVKSYGGATDSYKPVDLSTCK